MKFRRRVRAFFDGSGMDRDLDREVRFHLEMETEKNMQRAMTRDAARRLALRNFGPMEKYKAEARDTRGVGWIDATVADLRYGIHALARNPAFALLAIVAYFVGQRTAEIGVRVALGARKREILAIVARQSLPPVAVGLVIGLASAAVLARSIETLLFDPSALNPSILFGAATALGVVASCACALPARAAARIDPVTALRE